MNRYHNVRYDMFRRVQQFRDEHQTLFPEGSPGAQAFAGLDAAVDALSQGAAVQRSSARDGIEQKRNARQALRFRLDAIARTAQVIAQTTPGFDEGFGLARPVNQQVLLAAARVFLEDAAPRAAAFVARGLPEDFVDSLRLAFERFEQASDVVAARSLRRAAAAAGIRTAVRQGMDAVRAIDVIVRYQLAIDSEVQAAWRRARQIPRRQPLRVSPSDSPATPSLNGSTAILSPATPSPLTPLTVPVTPRPPSPLTSPSGVDVNSAGAPGPHEADPAAADMVSLATSRPQSQQPSA